MNRSVIERYNVFRKRRIIFSMLFLIYIICVLYITLFSREPTQRRSALTPFWEYRNLLHEESDRWFLQITCNILMLVPFGSFLGYRFKRMAIFQAAVSGSAFSVFIELTQYFTGRGLLELDDVFNNTFGTVIGFVFIKLIIIYRDYKRAFKYY
ncbi:MAG: VanZ family protein [Oscillospiraceae bacterium]|nr:VanZ family protein [Oscillospiraceae bacterium]